MVIQFLSYVVLLLPFVVAAALGVLLPLLGAVMYRRFGVGLAVIMATAVIDTLMPSLPALQFGINVYLPDLVFGGVAVLALLRWLLGRSDPSNGRPSQVAGAPPVTRLRAGALAVFALVFAINLAQGLIEYKGAAGVAARPTFYALATCGYAIGFVMNEQRLAALFKAYAWAALAMVLIVIWRGVAVAFDIRELLPVGGSFQPAGHSIWRVVASAESLLVAQVARSFWFFGRLLPSWSSQSFAALLMVLVTVALQHRSVWLAAMAGVIVSLWHPGAARRRFSLWMLPALAAGVLLAATLVANPETGAGQGPQRGDVASDIAGSARDALDMRGTAADRLSSWRQLLKRWADSGPRGLALGAPLGATMERYTSDDLSARKVNFQPHNFYVEVLVSHGLIGLIAYLAMYATALWGLFRARRDPRLGVAAHWLLMLLIVQMTYFITYGIHELQTLALGAALSLAAAVPKAVGRSPGARQPALGET